MSNMHIFSKVKTAKVNKYRLAVRRFCLTLLFRNHIKHLVEIWVEGARKGERYGEWIERIGWEKFFEIAGLEFTDKHIDDFTFSVKTYHVGNGFKFTK